MNEKALFETRLRPVLQARGYAKFDQKDVLEALWAEFCHKRKQAYEASDRGEIPVYPEWPRGLTSEEKAYVHGLANSLEAGHIHNWLTLTQLRPPAFPNGFTKEDFLRLAALEVRAREERLQSQTLSVPRRSNLSEAERIEVNFLRDVIRDGRPVIWAGFRLPRSEEAPNELQPFQLLALAAGLPTEDEEERACIDLTGEESL